MMPDEISGEVTDEASNSFTNEVGSVNVSVCFVT